MMSSYAAARTPTPIWNRQYAPQPTPHTSRTTHPGPSKAAASAPPWVPRSTRTSRQRPPFAARLTRPKANYRIWQTGNHQHLSHQPRATSTRTHRKPTFVRTNSAPNFNYNNSSSSSAPVWTSTATRTRWARRRTSSIACTRACPRATTRRPPNS